jgi:hypothetical protein
MLAAGCSLLGPDDPKDTASALYPDCVGPATTVDPVIAASLPDGDEASINTNMIWAALAERVPGGFAGIHRNIDNGAIVLRLVDVSQAPAAKAALAGVFDTRFVDMANAEVLAARWDFNQLWDWMNYLVQQGITPGGRSGGFGIDAAENRLVYYVEDAGRRDQVLRDLSKLDLPCGLVYVDVIGVIRDASR